MIHVHAFTLPPSPAAMEDDDFRKRCECGAREPSASTYWGVEHRCADTRRLMGIDMGWVRDGRSRRWIECIRCGQAAEVGSIR